MGTQEKPAPRAKWVSKEEFDAWKEKGLCFHCGASGHRADKCPYHLAIPPANASGVSMHTTYVSPVLEEDDKESEDSDEKEVGKA
jgi:hypothetical protein